MRLHRVDSVEACILSFDRDRKSRFDVSRPVVKCRVSYRVA